MRRPVLVPLDGSQPGEAVQPWAVCLARARNLPLVLCRAMPCPPHSTSVEAYARLLVTMRETMDAYLQRVQQALADEGLPVEARTRAGDPAETILSLADEVGASTIVMASEGRGGLSRLVLGSVAESVLRRATLPVLLVRASAEQTETPPRFTRLLVPLDGSLLAEQALNCAREIAAEGAAILLLRVVAPVERAVAHGRRVSMTMNRTETRHALAQADEYLGRLAQTVATHRVSVETQVRIGDVTEEILAAVREHAVDLVVMGTRGRTGPARWLMGSVADEVARRSERPVFLASVRAMAAYATGSFTVGDVMSDEVATLRADDSLITAVRKLMRPDASGAAVLDRAGELAGFVSERDLLVWQARLVDELAGEAAITPADYVRRLETETVGQLMSRPVVTVDEATSLSPAIRLLVERRLRMLPVTRGGRLIGTLTRAAALEALATHREAAAPASASETATDDGIAGSTASAGGPPPSKLCSGGR